MKKREGQKGFTLIELLIVVAILGVLAAVVIPNVGRFLGSGEQEANDTELQNLQTAVVAMMTDNNISTLPNPVAVGTTDMTAFPDATSAVTVDKIDDPTGAAYAVGDGAGFLLFGHDITANAANLAADQVNYLASNTTKCEYTVIADGTVTQGTC